MARLWMASHSSYGDQPFDSKNRDTRAGLWNVPEGLGVLNIPQVYKGSVGRRCVKSVEALFR